MIRTYRYRIKDSSAAPQLNQLARACNQVWNFCNESQEHALRWNQRWPTYQDLCKLTTGSSKELGLHSQTVQAVCEQYATRRQQFKKRSRQARNLQAKIANRRKDFLHKESDRLTKDCELIVVGDVCSSGLAKTNMAKSVKDAGWSTFKRLLEYKAIARKVVYREVSERFSTQTCSGCGAIGGPTGREGLGIREWVCGECGAVHDRDVNAALNILRLGHQSLALK